MTGEAAFALDRYIPYLLHQAHKAILARFDLILRDHGLSLPEWRVLAALHQGQALRFGELVAAAGLEPPTLARVLTRLEQRHWLLRQPSGQDRRGTVIAVTAAGRAVAASLIPGALATEAAALADFSADEIEFLVRLLRRISSNLAAPRGPTSPAAAKRETECGRRGEGGAGLPGYEL